MIEGVGFVTRDDSPIQPMHGHVHQTELGVVLHLLLSVEGHIGVGIQSCLIHEITRLHKHATRTTGGVEHHALRRLKHVDQHLYQRFRREEHTVVRGYRLGKLREEIFIDAADDVATHFVDGFVIEDAKQFAQKVIGKHGVGLRQYARQLFALVFHQLHGVVHSLSQRVDFLSVLGLQSCCHDIVRQIHQIVELCLTGQVQGALGGEVAGLHGHHSSAATGTVLQDF